jgi:hypothetical protein
VLGALGFLDDRHTPGGHPHPQIHHGRGGVVSLLASVKRAGGIGGAYFADGRYFDWSSRRQDGSFGFEGGDDSESGGFDIGLDDLTRLHEALTDALDEKAEDPGQLNAPGDEGWYFDWSAGGEDSNGNRIYDFEFGTPEETTQIELAAVELQQLHTALTMTLLVEATKAESA